MKMAEVKKDIFVIAHRGGAELFFENTLTAFRNAQKLGVDAIECDVHLTKDGKLVIMHDPDLKRVAGIEKNISDMTLEEIKDIKLNGGESIPTLQEVIDELKITLVVEIKSYDTVAEIVKLLIANPELQKRIIIICFDHRAILNLKKFFPNLETGALLAGLPVDPVSVAKACMSDTLSMYHEGLDRNFIDLCHAGGIKVSVWTPNNSDEIKKMIDLGVDAIASDRPDTVLKLLGR